MNTLKLLALSTALTFAITGCKKKEEPAPTPAAGSATTPAAGSATTPAAGSATTPAAGSGSDQGSAAGSGSAAAPARDPNADFVSILAKHAEPKPDDPVEIHIDRFKVTKSSFDPKTIEGGTAELELDLTSINSGSAKRDGHLQTPDYIDTAKFATATIKIDNVKKKDDKHFSADAAVNLRAIDKKYPIEFEVLEVKDDGSIRIKGEHTFSRLDFGVGKDSKDPKEAPVQPDLTIKLQLTLKKS
jgi:polyisoprenoid-binding protein YceI